MKSTRFKEMIEDYTASIFAIVGFANLLRYDDEKKEFKKDIKIVQGKRLKTSKSNRIIPDGVVTPDLCICNDKYHGIVAEVKKSFPVNQEHWMDDFKQLMSYDDNFKNWITNEKGHSEHEIILLPEQGRCKAVIIYYEDRKGKDIVFNKNFIVVQFNRSDELRPFIFFRTEYGAFNNFEDLKMRLTLGVKVPMEKLVPLYEKIKLYDAKPPLPYLLHLIWENVIMLRASMDEKFARMRKYDVNITIDEIVGDLRANYSFKTLNDPEDSDNQEIPKKQWVEEAINALVVFNLAKWSNKTKGECVIKFNKYKDTLEEFITLCAKNDLGIPADESEQGTLFEMSESG